MNIEGIRKSKSEFLSKLMTEYKVEMIAIHTRLLNLTSSNEAKSRGTTWSELLTMTFLYYNIGAYKNPGKLTTIKMNRMNIENVHNPPTINSLRNVMKTEGNLTTVYTEDFNSHNNL